MSEVHVTLPPRWYPLRPHRKQRALYEHRARFTLASAGRRSGKSENAKRALSKAAWSWSGREYGNFAYLAPTRDQAKRIAWQDLKDLSPPELIRSVSESDLRVDYVNGSAVSVVGMDKPQRIEGPPWDGFVVDEFADMKEQAWSRTIVPALSTTGRHGWAICIGKPKGRNHWYRLCERARDRQTVGESSSWQHLSWPSTDILMPDELAEARDGMDERAWRQEMLAEFVSEEGRAYYAFDREIHVQACKRMYNPDAPLLLCFDFNVEPGVCAVAQRHVGPDGWPVFYFIDEVFIEQDSNTPRVCAEVSERWKSHRGKVYAYGDASGGNRGTAHVDGSDWDLITAALRLTWPNRFNTRVPASNPPVRARINAINFALKSASGRVRMLVDQGCEHIIADLEGVTLTDAGDLDKNDDKWLTHLSDGMGYMLHYEQPPRISDEPLKTQQSLS